MQHDYNIANQLFPDTRVDWNAVLGAIVSNNAGASAPAVTFASMTYYNETDDIFYMRNKANSAWVAMGKIVADKWYPYLDGAQLGQGTDTVKGLWEKSTVPEGVALTSDLVVLTPLVLASILATESNLGIARFGTITETEVGTAADRAVSVQNLGRMWRESATPIATATTLVEPADANRGGVYSLTGSVTVANLWAGETAGKKVQFRLTGTPQFTNSATLIIPGGTRTFAANDVLEFTAEAANVWRLTNAQLANGKALVESISAFPTGTARLLGSIQTNAYDSTTSVIADDDTIPQIGEGKEILSLAVTPSNAASTLIIKGSGNLGHSAAQNQTVLALFVDATANALASSFGTSENANMTEKVEVEHIVSAGSTSARTYRLRFGPGSAGTCGINGSSGGRLHGGVLRTILEVWEILP